MELLRKRGVVILDGGLASELERRGHDLAHPLWSARLLMLQPEAVGDVHRAYLEAGADVITSAAYQASLPGFRAAGATPEEARELYLDSLRIARAARDAFGDPDRLVAASLGPYGAFLADGSEYHGHYGIPPGELEAFHRERIELLAHAADEGWGPDVVAVETLPSLAEALSVARILAGYPSLSAWFAFSCRGTATCEGQPIDGAVRALEAFGGIVAVGINCTAPDDVPGLLARLQGATKRPLVVYPNSGEAWDPRAKCWSGDSVFADQLQAAREWIRMGVRLVGGCCRTTPEDVGRLVQLREELAALS